MLFTYSIYLPIVITYHYGMNALLIIHSQPFYITSVDITVILMPNRYRLLISRHKQTAMPPISYRQRSSSARSGAAVIPLIQPVGNNGAQMCSLMLKQLLSIALFQYRSEYQVISIDQLVLFILCVLDVNFANMLDYFLPKDRNVIADCNYYYVVRLFYQLRAGLSQKSIFLKKHFSKKDNN